MKVGLYTIKDCKVNNSYCTESLFMAETDMAAERIIAMIKPHSKLEMFAKDYTLVKLGTVDTETGELENDKQIVREVSLIKGIEVPQIVKNSLTEENRGSDCEV